MLSIGAISSSAAAVSYYEKDDYYLENGGDPDAQGTWFGKGADALGLGGSVDRDDFKNILEGKLPNGDTLGRVRDGEIQHRPGWDLTFSAPKSVSVAAEIGGDDRLLAAHDKAVNTAMAWMEKEAGSYRQSGHLGVRTYTSGKLVAALFQHDTSRNQDPALHTHAVVANVTQRSDGQFASLDPKPLYQHKMAAGAVYRTVLAQEAQRLGYEIEKTGRDGRFELAAVTKDVRDHFSTRRAEIEAALEERGLSGAEASAQAALRTRDTKEIHDRKALTQNWESRAKAMGFSATNVVVEAEKRGDIRDRNILDMNRAVSDSVDRLAEAEAVFTHAELVRWTLADNLGKAQVADVEAGIKRLEKAGALQKSDLGGRAAWTTPRAKEMEKRVLRSLSEGKGVFNAIAKDHEADRIGIEKGLDQGQQAALRLIATSKDRYTGVLGRPGAGKTFMMNAARELLESKGYDLKGMAQNSEAARKLALDSGMASSTLQRHLAIAGRDAVKLQRGSRSEQKEIQQRYSKAVWVVDEASQVDAGLMRRLSYQADVLGARVVLVGDPKQLAAIQAGKPFAMMLESGMKHAEMDQIRRQNEERHINAIRDVVGGDTDSALDKLLPETQELPDKDQRLDAMLAQYRAAGDKREDLMMLTSTNRDKQTLNAGARQILRDENKLKDESEQRRLQRVSSSMADRKSAQTYQVGDKVRFARDYGRLDVKNGEYRDVVGVDEKSNQVTLGNDRGDTVRWNPREIAGGSKQGVEIYRPQQSSVAAGERIRWTRPDKDRGLANGEILTVEKAAEGQFIARKDSGERLKIDTRQENGQHWEHGYASTVYSSQGQTAKHVLVNAEGSARELMNQKAFLVAISRQKESLTLYTDNREQLAKNVREQLGEKTSAIEGRMASNMSKAVDLLDRVMGRDRDALQKQPALER